MKRVLKILGIILGVLVVVIVILAIVVVFLSNSALNKTVEVEVASVEIPDADDEVLARGEYLVRFVGACVECHGPALAGDNLFDEQPFGAVDAPNLTSGEGGIGDYTDVDFVRAIRHGVSPDGTRLLIMPTKSYANFSEEDLGAIIAYVQSLPPQDNELDDPNLVIARAILVMSEDDFFEYEKTDHEAPLPDAVEEGVTAEYGEYLANISCAGCHGNSFSGGSVPEGGTEAPNLSPGGPLAEYSEDDFFTVLREGTALDGSTIDDEDMPWPAFGGMNDDDLSAIFTFLQSLDALEFGEGEE